MNKNNNNNSKTTFIRNARLFVFYSTAHFQFKLMETALREKAVEKHAKQKPFVKKRIERNKNRSVLIFLWCCFELCIIIFIIIAIITNECGECKLHGSSHPVLLYTAPSTRDTFFIYLFIYYVFFSSFSVYLFLPFASLLMWRGKKVFQLIFIARCFLLIHSAARAARWQTRSVEKEGQKKT